MQLLKLNKSMEWLRHLGSGLRVHVASHVWFFFCMCVCGYTPCRRRVCQLQTAGAKPSMARTPLERCRNPTAALDKLYKHPGSPFYTSFRDLLQVDSTKLAAEMSSCLRRGAGHPVVCGVVAADMVHRNQGAR